MLVDLAVPHLLPPKIPFECDQRRLASVGEHQLDVYEDISRLVSQSVSPVATDSPSILDEDQLSPTSSTAGYPLSHVPRVVSAVYDAPASPSFGQLRSSTGPQQVNNNFNNNAYVGSFHDSDSHGPYLSDSPGPSPVDGHPPLPPPPQPARASSFYPTSYPTSSEYFGPPSQQPTLSLDQRRMSDPAVHPDLNYRYQDQRAAGHVHREASMPHLRQQYRSQPSPPPGGWRANDGPYFEDPVSPYRPTFADGTSPPIHGGWPADNRYGPSPPSTGQGEPSSPDAEHKKYAFVALPGNNVKKRPRRRADEIERLYKCSWPDCPKAYGTLNHLNAHVTMQKHGPKRQPSEFKELRKQWRKAKREPEGFLPTGMQSYQSPYEHGVPSQPTNRYSYPPGGTAPHWSDHGHTVGDRRSLDDRDGRFQSWMNQPTPHSYGRTPMTTTTTTSQYSSLIPPPPLELQQRPLVPEHLRQDPTALATDYRLPGHSALLTPPSGYQPPPDVLPPLDSTRYYDNVDEERPSSGHRPAYRRDQRDHY